MTTNPTLTAFLTVAPPAGPARERYFEASAVEPQWVDVDLGQGITITVSADMVKGGGGARLAVWPSTAQRIADRFDALLPTTKIVDSIWRAATVKIAPHPMEPRPGVGRDSNQLLLEHENIINGQVAGRTGLIDGAKKSIVVGGTMAAHPGRLVIYGWHTLAGVPIQGLENDTPSYIHSVTYGQDYSTGVRLVKRMARKNGVPTPLTTLFANPSDARALSAGGVLSPAQLRYPTS